MKPQSDKPTIAIDFDGVIHAYTSQWVHAGVIADDAVPGFWEWADTVCKFYRLVIFSSRCDNEKAIDAMRRWLIEQRTKWRKEGGKTDGTAHFEFATRKPSAHVLIDDRAIQFRGRWDAPELSLEAIRNFKPWNKQ